MGVAIGIVLGGTQALARSYFSLLIPQGREGEFFSFYHALDRGTSWFGTLTFGLVYQLTDSYRPAIFALIMFFVVGGLLLVRVDTARGIREAGNVQPSVI
jgi:UMF1 family MFS transporter